MGSFAPGCAKKVDRPPDLSDVARIKARRVGKVIAKGMMEPEDARLAVASGADALIVSNHCDRQPEDHGL